MKFSDEKYWNSLEDKYLSSYRLPNWDKPYVRDQFELWIERLDLDKRIFAEIMACSPDEFDNLNHWPMRAMIGLMLEYRNDH